MIQAARPMTQISRNVRRLALMLAPLLSPVAMAADAPSYILTSFINGDATLIIIHAGRLPDRSTIEQAMLDAKRFGARRHAFDFFNAERCRSRRNAPGMLHLTCEAALLHRIRQSVEPFAQTGIERISMNKLRARKIQFQIMLTSETGITSR